MTKEWGLTVAAAVCLLALPAAAQTSGAGGPRPGMGLYDGPSVPGAGGAPDMTAEIQMMNGMAGMYGMGNLAAIDTNHDGNITKEEWMAAFDKMDANHDGTISREEIQAMNKGRMQKMEQIRAQMMQRIQELEKLHGGPGLKAPQAPSVPVAPAPSPDTIPAQ